MPMRFLILSFASLSVFLMACGGAAPSEEESSDDLAMVVLAEEEAEPATQKVSFASEDESYLYSFEYDKASVRYLGYPLEGMQDNGGAFLASNGAEIVTFTSDDKAVGMESQVGDYTIFTSIQEESECVYEYRVVAQEPESLTLRAKSCEGQDPEVASQALDMMTKSLAIDAL